MSCRSTCPTAPVPLRDLADIRDVAGPAPINRRMGMRRIVVGVNVPGRDLSRFVAELQGKVGQQVPLQFDRLIWTCPFLFATGPGSEINDRWQ